LCHFVNKEAELKDIKEFPPKIPQQINGGDLVVEARNPLSHRDDSNSCPMSSSDPLPQSESGYSPLLWGLHKTLANNILA
jgi:hypothetical protein